MTADYTSLADSWQTSLKKHLQVFDINISDKTLRVFTIREKEKHFRISQKGTAAGRG